MSVSAGYWPAIWPQAEAKTGLTLTRAAVQLPVMSFGSSPARRAGGLEEPPVPVLAPPLARRVLSEPKYERFLRVGLSDHVSEVHVRDYSGGHHGQAHTHAQLELL